jgi:hypothetical protein
MSPHPSVRGDEPTPGHAASLYNLVYCSRATAGVDAAEVDRIIATARRDNPARAITGLLVFGSGIFFQWLEGPRDSVVELMALIAADARHHSVVMLNPGEDVSERLFADWDMELVGGDEVRTVLVDALDNAHDPASVRALQGMLEQLESGQLSSIGRE